MSFEIVYTSVRRGLQGRQGFCTVAATPGIPRLLHEKLESLSGYRHTFSGHSVDAHLNPVNYSHLIVRIMQERYYVLSRIADCGTDYSGRANKIAHHLALAESELRGNESGPVGYLFDDSFWYTAWDREPEELPGRRMPQPIPADNAGPATWEAIFGDAGWAGVPARGFLEDFQPVTVIVPPGHDCLALVQEAMQFVAPRDRWKVCFSTHFTRMPVDSELHWRFVLDDTDKARDIRAGTTGIVIDPKNSGTGLSNDDRYVVAARTGDLSVLAGSKQDFGPEPSDDDRRPSTHRRRTPTRSQLRRRQAGSRARQARIARTRQPEFPAQPTQPATSPAATDSPSPSKSPSRRSPAAWLAIVALISAAAFAAGWFIRGQSDEVGAMPPPAPSVRLGAETTATRRPQALVPPPEQPEQVPVGDDAPDQDDANAPPVQQAVADAEPDEMPQPDPEPAKPVVEPPALPEMVVSVFDDVRDRKRYLDLPYPGEKRSFLTILPVPDDADVELSLIGGNSLPGSEERYVMTIDDESPRRAWKIHREKRDPVFKAETLGPVGRFALEDDGLQFHRAAEAETPDLFRLRRCLLDIRVGDESEVCFLTAEPADRPAVPFVFDGKGQGIVVPIEIPPHELPDPEFLRLDMQLVGLDETLGQLSEADEEAQYEAMAVPELQSNQSATLLIRSRAAEPEADSTPSTEQTQTSEPQPPAEPRPVAEFELTYQVPDSARSSTAGDDRKSLHALTVDAYVYVAGVRRAFMDVERRKRASRDQDAWKRHLEMFDMIGRSVQLQYRLYYVLPDYPDVQIDITRTERN